MEPELSVGFQPEQEAGQPSENVQPDTGTETPQPQYVTLDQFNTLKNSLDDLVERRVQGWTDRAGKKFITQKVQEQVDSLKAIATEMDRLPPNTPPAIRDRLYEEALAQVGGDVGKPPAQEITPEIAMTNAAAKLLEVEADVELTKGDTELASLIQDKGPKEFLKSYKAALANKKTRLEGAAQQETVDDSSISRMTGVGSGSPAGGLQALAKEFHDLLDLPTPTETQRKRMDELEVKLTKHVKIK